MDHKYPHWYHEDSCMEPTCDCMEHQPMMHDCMPMYGEHHFMHQENFSDHLMRMMGNRVLISLDASFCKCKSLCGILCFVGCDFVILNICRRRKPIAMHIPINMIKYIAIK